MSRRLPLVGDKRIPPYWQCYATDWIGKEEYVCASLAERGLLFSLANYCWPNSSIPSDPATMAKLLGLNVEDVSKALGNLIDVVTKPDGNAGRLYMPELDTQFNSMMRERQKRAEGGRKGGISTQAKLKQSSSSAKAPDMNGDEMNGDEIKGNAVFKGAGSSDHEEWLNQYNSTT